MDIYFLLHLLISTTTATTANYGTNENTDKQKSNMDNKKILEVNQANLIKTPENTNLYSANEDKMYASEQFLNLQSKLRQSIESNIKPKINFGELDKNTYKMKNTNKKDTKIYSLLKDLNNKKNKINLKIKNKAHRRMNCPKKKLKTASMKNQASPNIIVVLVDDLGFGDLSGYGHPTSFTPHIDDVISKSKTLTQFYVTSPICSPSRASLLTGRYPSRNGVYPGTFIPDSKLGLPLNETTIAKLLKTKGYKTAIVGKWHLGVGKNKEFLPTNFGFDEYLGIPYSHDMCPTRVCFPGDQPCHDLGWSDKVSCPLFEDTTIVEQPTNLTTLTAKLVSKAVNFITSSSSPFFLYLPFHHVHHPQFSGGRFFNTSVRGSMGDSLRELDWAFGEVIHALKVHNVYDNTLIWFTSDNGPSLTRHERGGCAGPLRCGKGTTWEGGVRVPTFVHWNNKISPGRSSALLSTLDILPTLAALTGSDVSSLVLDGVDASKFLLDSQATEPREFYAVYPESPNRNLGPFAVIWNDLKAHFYTKGSDLSDADNFDAMCPASHHLTKHDPPLLFNIRHDPGERYNIAAGHEIEISKIVDWRNSHMRNMTWMSARTQVYDARSQPCCTTSICEPFPQCCDCNKIKQ